MRNHRRRFVLAASSIAALAACGEGSLDAAADPLAARQAGDEEIDRADDVDLTNEADDEIGTKTDGDQRRRRPRKIIIDSDYNTMSDDGQAGVMAAQLQAQGLVKVLGITVVSGNKWLRQGVAEALKSVERLGVEKQIPVFAGENYALNHDYATVQAELAAGAGGDGYLGAWSTPEPTAVTHVFRNEWFSPLFEQDPNHTSSIWDTLTVAYLIDPRYATEVTKEYLDVVVNPGGADNGRSVGYRRRPRGRKLQRVRVVRRFDNDRFYELYVDLLTRPVPISLPGNATRDRLLDVDPDGSAWRRAA